MFRLQTLELQNFLSFESAKVDFSRPGIYVIQGYNEIGGGSNGSGKSTIFAGICFALTGKTPAGLQYEDVRRWATKDPVRVAVTFVDRDGQLYEIVRTNGDLAFRIGDNIIRGNKRDIQDSINATFRTNYSLFTRVNLFTQHSGELLVGMGDADRKRLLKMILGLEEIDEVAERVKKEYDKLQREYDTETAKLHTVESLLQSHLNSLELTQKQAALFETELSKKRQDLEEQIKALTTKPKQTLEGASALQEQIAALESALANTPGEEDQLQERLLHVQNEMAIVSARISDNQEFLTPRVTKYAQLSPSDSTVCPECGSTVPIERLTHHFKEIQNRISEDIQTLRQLQKDYTVLEHKLTYIRDTQSKISALKQQLKEHELMVAYHAKQDAADKRLITTLKIELEKLDSATNPFPPLILNLESSINQEKAEAARIREELQVLSNRIDLCGFLKRILSREGVISYIIERAFGRLEFLTNHFLGAVCSEGFKVEIRPQKELKSGAFKEEIDIVVKKQDIKIPATALSGGQLQRLNLAILLSIFLLCRDYNKTSFDFLLLDEILDLSLDTKGQEEVTRLLQVVQSDIYHICVISHKEGIVQDGGIPILIHRNKDGISSIVS